MHEEGTVADVQDRTARVEMADAKTCRGCGACARIGGRMLLDVQLDPDTDVHPGDRVLVEIPAEPSFRGAALVYVVPLAGLFLGALAGSLITSTFWPQSSWPNLLPMLLALLGLAGGFWFASWADRHLRRGARAKMRILHRL